MGLFNSIRLGSSAAGGYEIERSVRISRDSGNYFSVNNSSSGNTQTFTFSFWIKLAKPFNNHLPIYSHYLTGSNRCGIVHTGTTSSSAGFQYQNRQSNSHKALIDPAEKLRDHSAWYHVVFRMDTTNGTQADRFITYVNGRRIQVSSGSILVVQNSTSVLNSATTHYIGHDGHSGTGDFYLADIHLIDGQALDASSFAETDAITGQWIPKEYSGSYSGTSYHLKFDDNNLFDNFVDSSSSAHTITTVGNVLHKSDQTKNGATSIYFDGSGDSLRCSDSTDFTVGTNDFTIEAYIRRTSQGNDEWFFVQSDGTPSNTSIGLHIGSSSSAYANKPALRYRVGSTDNDLIATTALATNTWYHIAGVRDGNTVRIYVNGTQENSASESGSIIDSSANVIIGAVDAAGSAGLTGHMDQVRWSNSCRYPDGTSFTAPTTQFTNDSNTKFLLQSNVTGTLGTDSSGLGNHVTPVNFSVSAGAGNDSLEDSPTNNFATFNSLVKSANTFSEGNLQVTMTSSTPATFYSTIGVSSGKYYMEFLLKSVTNYPIGISSTTRQGDYLSDSTSDQIGFWVQSSKTNVFRNGSDITANSEVVGNFETGVEGTSTAWAVDDIAGLALDMDNKIIYLYKGSTQVGSVNFSTFNYSTVFFGGGNYISGNVYIGNFGQRPFSNLPAGYKALCSANLPDPTIKLPDKHFDTLLYTGDSNTSRNITGLQFQPDWVWIKRRSASANHRVLDSVRGSTKELYPNLTNTEQTFTGISSFNSDGFTLATADSNYNLNTATYVAWNWNAGGSTVTNNDGTISSQVRANTSAGFSIVSYTGTGSTATVGHGLGVTPNALLIKNRDSAQNWIYWQTSMGDNNLILNSNQAQFSASGNSTMTVADFSSTVFKVVSATQTNSTDDFIAYCFSEVAGYSKFGSYKGNGNADGTFVFTGFRPAYVLVKDISSSYSWDLHDNKRDPDNVTEESLAPNLSNAEDTYDAKDFLANGFKLRSSSNSLNKSGDTYIYLAFAESPFKYARAR